MPSGPHYACVPSALLSRLTETWASRFNCSFLKLGGTSCLALYANTLNWAGFWRVPLTLSCTPLLGYIVKVTFS